MSREKALDALKEGAELADENGSSKILMAGAEAEDILEGLAELGVEEEAILLPEEDGFTLVPEDANGLDDGVKIDTAPRVPADD